MNPADETIRNAITHALSERGIDSRRLSVNVVAGAVAIRGSVPSEEQRSRIPGTVAAVVPDDKTAQIAVSVG